MQNGFITTRASRNRETASRDDRHNKIIVTRCIITVATIRHSWFTGDIAHLHVHHFRLRRALISRGDRYRRPPFSAVNQLAVPRQIPLNKLGNGVRCTCRELSLSTSRWILGGELRVDLCDSVHQLARGERLSYGLMKFYGSYWTYKMKSRTGSGACKRCLHELVVQPYIGKLPRQAGIN